jgi:hypothetical protein
MAEETDEFAIREGQPPIHVEPSPPNPNPDQAKIWVVILGFQIGCFVLFIILLIMVFILPTILSFLGIRLPH